MMVFGGIMETALPETEKSAGTDWTVKSIPKSFTAKPKRGEWDGVDGKKLQPCYSWKKFNEALPPLKEIGCIEPRHSRDVRENGWSVPCTCLDRDYADFTVYEKYVGEIGVKHAQLQSGWAKTEQHKGVYNFEWLDVSVNGLVRQGVKPWVCICYGNPLYGSDFKLGMKIRQILCDEEARAAWHRYVAALITRYKDRVFDWEIWNEPFRQGRDYGILIAETAKTIRKIQPEAHLIVSGMRYPTDYRECCEYLKSENALDCVDEFMYHPYALNPDACELGLEGVPGAATEYAPTGTKVRELLHAYNPRWLVTMGESGCAAQLEYAHAMPGYPWTEFSQVKWDTRHALLCAGLGFRYNMFAMIDMQYPYMLQSFGLLRSTTLLEVVYKRPKYYAYQHICALFDDTVKNLGLIENECEIFGWADANERGKQRKVTSVGFKTEKGDNILAAWYGDRIPSDGTGWDRVNLTVKGIAFKDPVFVDIVTGRIFELKRNSVFSSDGVTTFWDLPLRDSPIVIKER